MGGYSEVVKAIRYTEITRGSVTHISLSKREFAQSQPKVRSFRGFLGEVPFFADGDAGI